ncbi:zinc ribbon domain-containing protein [Halopiger xanaduensis]|uniref:DUF7575 domain-containing protein n=1 Tax=Halopiger xanaduensis (strain DSM 18323 / JCM 14033 / SH-6) TaxID=797210 RepID=F8DDC9_HALXS|nr:zinc ribbon domain-containing protein [Halopiger xanaduensis]AEH39018.1 hypothetical protein Halxa_0417 [Halopiger xanaduensis SH-6]
MPRSVSQKRPWLAALLAALVTGFGHLYLRRLRRAAGWLVLSVAVTALFVDPAAIDEILAGTANRDVLLAVAPSLFVTGLSVIDAYLLARAHVVRSQSPVEGTADTEEAISCPHCGKDLDPELDFCHWCTTPLEDHERERSDEMQES